MKELVMLLSFLLTVFTVGGALCGLFSPKIYSKKQHICIAVAALISSTLTVTWSILYGA